MSKRQRNMAAFIAQELAAFNESTVLKGLTYLTERQRYILCLYWGLCGEQPHNCREIGEQQGVTRERIRQIKYGALRRLNYVCARLKGGREPILWRQVQ